VKSYLPDRKANIRVRKTSEKNDFAKFDRSYISFVVSSWCQVWPTSRFITSCLSRLVKGQYMQVLHHAIIAGLFAGLGLPRSVTYSYDLFLPSSLVVKCNGNGYHDFILKSPKRPRTTATPTFAKARCPANLTTALREHFGRSHAVRSGEYGCWWV